MIAEPPGGAGPARGAPPLPNYVPVTTTTTTTTTVAHLTLSLPGPP
jgi:hypothetical protein